MARIAGVNLPTNKRVVIALQYIHGIGQAKAKEITDEMFMGSAYQLAHLVTESDLEQGRRSGRGNSTSLSVGQRNCWISTRSSGPDH